MRERDRTVRAKNQSITSRSTSTRVAESVEWTRRESQNSFRSWKSAATAPLDTRGGEIIDFPVALSDPGAATQQAVWSQLPGGMDPTAQEGGRKYKSLVVDDIDSNRKILTRILEKEGHSTRQAEDGLKALEEYDKAGAEGCPFDFIFMDFVMPNLDGPSAVRELRCRGCEVPIIGVTGNVMREDVEAFKGAGANEVMGKPVKAVKLREVLSDLSRNNNYKCTEIIAVAKTE